MGTIEHWLHAHIIQPIQGDPARLEAARLGLTLLLAAILAWGAPGVSRQVARRLRRSGRRTAPAALEEAARPLRWVVLLLCLYEAASWLLGEGHDARAVAGVVFVIMAYVATRGAVRVVRLLLAAAFERALPRVARDESSESQQALLPLSQRIVMVIVWLFALVIVLDHFGQSISSVITLLGVGSLAIGLAAQQVLSNVIAGLVLVLDKPFRIGDRIRMAGLDIGRVEEMGLRTTHIRLADGNLLIVPNSDLVGAKIINYSSAEGVRGEVRVQVPASMDLEQLGAGLVEEIAALPGIRGEPPPRFLLLTLADKLELALTFVLAPHSDAPQVEELARRLVLRRVQHLTQS